MSKRYVKNEKGYKKTSTFDEKMIAEAMKRLKPKKGTDFSRLRS
jgi:hypothetical protein